MRTILVLLFLLIMGGVFSPCNAQSYSLVNADSIATNTGLKAQYNYTYLYITNVDVADSLAYTDTIMVYTYHPISQTWIPAKLVDLTTNTLTDAGTAITLPDGSKKVYAFYEMYLYGWRIIRINTAPFNNTTLSIFSKSIGGQ